MARGDPLPGARGALIGAWHGFWVAYVGIPAFIVTLASMLIFRGLTLVVLNGATVGGLPDGFESMGNGFLPESARTPGCHNLTLLLAALLVGVPGRSSSSASAPRPSATTSTVIPSACSSLKLVVDGRGAS